MEHAVRWKRYRSVECDSSSNSHAGRIHMDGTEFDTLTEAVAVGLNVPSVRQRLKLTVE